MKKILNFLKKYNYIFILFTVGLIIISTIYILQDVAPFGKNSLLTIDFFHQYGPMLAELYDRIHTGESLIYSFNTGLGLPLFRNFFNYLSSPINLIILLFKRKDLIMSYSIIIGLKSILSSITMYYYLRKKLNIKNIALIGLSFLYAYSAYFTAYYWNIMWIDGMYLLPLIILGIENIVNKNNGLLYTMSLTIMIYTNYFIGYMICIFSCIYFVAYSIIKYKNFKKIKTTTLKFIICSLCSGLLLAWMLIPMFEALTSTNATTGTMPTSQYYFFTIINFFKNHLTSINSTVFASDISNAPNVSCGILSIALFIIFIINNKISAKRKLIYSAILFILLASFTIAQIDYIWHAFHVPNDLPYRYSFIYSFSLITIGAYVLKNIKNIKFIKILISFILCMIFITFVYLTKYNNIDNDMIIVNYLLITTYFLIYCLFHFFPKFTKLSSYLFILITALECIISVNHNWNILQYIDEFYYDYNDINSSIKEIHKTDTELFYRTEKNNILTLNDGAWYDYYGQTTFSSMAYNNISELNNNLGQPGNTINSYYYKQNTPIYDLMFNIKYTIGNNIDNKRYKERLNNKGTRTYMFKYTTGLMFGANSSIKEWKYNYINPLEFQNDFIENCTNINNTLYRLTLNSKEIISDDKNNILVKYNYKNEYDNIYIYSNNSLINYIIIDDKIYYKDNVDINNIALKLNKNFIEYNSYNEEYIINTISDKENIEIFIGFSQYLYEEADVYTINNEKFEKAYNILNKEKVKISKFKENYIEGNVNLENDKSIFTSISYDKGWKVYSNGKQLKTYIINDSLLGFDLKKGKNNVILKFIPNNIDIGIGISVTTTIALVTYLIIKRKKSNH